MKEKLFEYMKNYAYKYSQEPFKLASGKLSHHYFNCKEILLFPDRLELLANYLISVHLPTYELEPESIGGLTMGADPICYAVSLAYQRAGLIVYPLIIRKEAKDHGTKNQIEGAISRVKSCIVVDDVITTGGSTIKAIEALRNNGINVNNAICILDREEGGRDALSALGVKLFPIFKKSDFGNQNLP
jgi:orotate phosphoribosyltransferase